MKKGRFVKNRKKKNFILLAFVFLFVFIGLGYATLGTQLGIGGQLDVSKYDNTCHGFRTASWATIKSNVASDLDYYPVGCTKSVQMDINNDGTNETYTLRVANNTRPSECNGEGFSQTACGFVVEFADIITNHRVNPYTDGTTNGDGNKGGWEYSEMRTYLNDNTANATSIYNALPSDLRNVIIDTTVVSSRGPHDSANFVTTDKLYLLNPKEVWNGGTAYDSYIIAYDTSLGDTRQLDYYANIGVSTDNSSGAIKKLNNTNSRWVFRSANCTSNNLFICVHTTGGWTDSNSFDDTGVSPAFRINTGYNTIQFNANGGTVQTASIKVNVGEAIGTLPTPTNDPDYVFNGWFTLPTGGDAITRTYVPTADIQLYARWTYLPVTETIYWALQDNDSDSVNETLVISSNQVSGNQSGSFAGNTSFASSSDVPWIIGNVSTNNNLSYNVTTVSIEGTVVPQSTANWFQGVGFNASTFTANLDNLITSQTTNMSSMFDGAGFTATTFELDLSGLDISKVTDMSGMFIQAGYYATTWNIGDLSGWNTSNVIDMNNMFAYTGVKATTWNVGNISGWNTSQVTYMQSAFEYAGSNDTTFSLDLSGWDTSNVIDMNNMFDGAGYKATTFELDLSGWDTSQVTNMRLMFADAGYSATTWNIRGLSGLDTSKVTNMSSMFSDAGHGATTIELDLSGWDTSKVTTMKGMFSFAGHNATTFNLDLSGWDTSQVMDMSTMFFQSGYSATTFKLDLSGWDTFQVTDMSRMFLASGYIATTWSITIPQTNGGGISNTTSAMYGSTTSTYTSPNSGREFTLASN